MTLVLGCIQKVMQVLSECAHLLSHELNIQEYVQAIEIFALTMLMFNFLLVSFYPKYEAG